MGATNLLAVPTGSSWSTELPFWEGAKVRNAEVVADKGQRTKNNLHAVFGAVRNTGPYLAGTLGKGLTVNTGQPNTTDRNVGSRNIQSGHNMQVWTTRVAVWR